MYQGEEISRTTMAGQSKVAAGLSNRRYEIMTGSISIVCNPYQPIVDSLVLYSGGGCIEGIIDGHVHLQMIPGL
jgi:hypothetical protein